jgi:hypothetical protein
MATSRQFTYGGTGAAPSGTTKTGSIWVGTPTSPERYDLNYGGKVWWMGPDEDNRYVIGKDVPTEDWPAKGDTPPYPHDSGSVRFWASTNKTEGAFVTRVNSLPARAGQPQFDDGPQCMEWLEDNGYWTNGDFAPIDPNTFYALFRVHNSPTSNQYSEPFLDYCSAEDKMFGWNKNMGGARANGIIPDVSTTAQNSLYIVSESNQYLPTLNSSGPGAMCFNGSDGYMNTGTSILKYNASNNTVVSRVSAQHGDTTLDIRRPAFESSTNKLFVPCGQFVDIYNTTTLSFSGSISMTSYAGHYVYEAITNTDDNEVLLYNKTKFTILNPSTNAKITTGNITGMDNIRNGKYNSAEGKYYIGGQGSNNKPKIVIIDASTYAVTVVEISEGGGANNNLATSIALDTVRNVIWCMNDDRKIAALDCTNNSVTHYDTTFAGTWYAILPDVVNDFLIIGSRVSNNSGKYYKLTTVINDG